MALYLTLCRAVRALLGAARARGISSLAEGGGTCQARGARPTCPPCVPAPQPPCRARQPPPCRARQPPPCRARQPPRCRARLPPARLGTRVVCSAPPPQSARPPCSCPLPAPPLTCRQDVVYENCVSSSHACLPHAHPPRDPPSGHGCELDPVALRLQIARNARRADYEWEVACRAAAPPAPPTCPAPYALGGEREFARATDGCTYAVLHKPCEHAPPARCGPGPTPPPPPRCVELAPDDACRIRGDVHLDPCAHRPRVMIEIDRSTCTTSTSPAPACPQTSSSSNTTSTHAAPSSAPPFCRRPTIVERLRARPTDCQSERHTHTSVTLSIATKSLSSMAGGLEGMLRSKEQLKEAGLGRVVTDAGAGPASHEKPPDGRLELCVPPGTERVAVHVSMTRAAGSSSASCPPTNVPKSTFSFVNFKKTPAPCGPTSAPCVPFTPTRCKPVPKTTTKRCSSMSAFMANTIVVNS